MAIIPVEGKPTTLVKARKKLKKKKISVKDTNEKAYSKTIVEAKRRAEVDFVTDPEERTLDFHYNRPDRNYNKLVKLPTFKDWYQWGEWKQKRRMFWRELQNRTIGKLQDKFLAIRLKEVERLQIVEEGLFEYLMPMKDEDGNPLEDEETGLASFALPLGNMSQVASTMLAVMERKMLLRGDAIHRTESLGGNKDEGDIHLHAHVHTGDGTINDITEEEAQKLARTLIKIRDPDLAQAHQTFIDTEGEAVDGEKK